MSEDELKQLKNRETRLSYSERVNSFVGAAVGASIAVASPSNLSIWAFMAAAAIVCLLVMHFGKTELGQIRRRIQELESRGRVEPEA